VTGPRKIDVAVRGWAAPDDLPLPPGGSGRRLPPSAWSLVFDTETGVGLGQQLRVGGYQVRKGTRLREQGLIVAACALTEETLGTVKRFAAEHGYRARTRAEFVQEVFLAVGYRKRGRIIGFNLPFDISRLAIHHDTAHARGTNRAMRGGFTFQLTPSNEDPWVQIKKIGAAAAFIRFAVPAGNHPEARNRKKGGWMDHHRGAFIDVATLAKTLLGGRRSLGRLAAALQTTPKADADHGQEITADYLAYAVQDVQVTWECYQALTDRYHASGFDAVTPDSMVYSEASIGKALLRQAHAPKWRRAQPDVPGWVTATIMEAYYGGRTETRIRLVPTPGVLVDFRSQYATSHVLQGLWRYQIGMGIDWHDEDPADVQKLLDQVTVDDVLDPELWRQLDALVLVEPDGDRLPTRARYRHPKGPLTVALPYRIGGPAQWWPIADCIASKLQTGKTPGVLRVLRFTPRPPSPDLRAVSLAGGTLDPAAEDAIKRLVERRAHLQQEMRPAHKAGDGTAVAVQGLDAVQYGQKLAASATSSGITIELNLVEHRTKQPVTVHLPTGGTYQALVPKTEEPGEYFHPLIATLVSAGGRLLLATAIALTHRLGGEYATCDTDGLFIAALPDGGLIPCPGGPCHTEDGGEAIRALSWQQIQADIITPFQRLNPYDETILPGSILRLEPENFDPDTGEQRVVECLAIAAKRYCLYTRDHAGEPVIVKRSEHGLGHLLPPTDDDWQTVWWQLIVRHELGLSAEQPEWFGQLATGSVTVATPAELRTWKEFNTGRPRAEQVGPFNFVMTAHTDRLNRGRTNRPRVLIAPLQRDPDKRADADWINKHAPTTGLLLARTGQPGDHIPGTLHALTLAAYWAEYRSRPEHKTLDPNGTPCHPWTRGLLQPAHITATEPLRRIGKETTPTADANTDPAQPTSPEISYDPPTCPGCSKPLTGKQKYCSDRCRKRTARSSESA
jgi:hypothetical protein